MGFILNLIATPLGLVMWGAYNLLNNYGLAIIAFTFITKVVLFPLAIKSQKSSAKMAVLSPDIKIIQKKYAKDRVKMQEELTNLYAENDYNQMAGCLPLLIQMPIILGLYEVIRNPLTHILRIPADVLESARKALELTNISTYQSQLKSIATSAPEKLNGILDSQYITDIQNFDMTFLGLDLTQIPTFALNIAILVPLVSISTMILSQVITMKLNGQADQAGKAVMMPMLIMSVAMTSLFAFQFPIGVTIYWIAGNIFAIIQSFALNAMHNPKKLRAEYLELKKQKQKTAKPSTKKVVKIKDSEGTTEKTVSKKEYEKLRLEKARELDKQKYGSDNDAVTEDNENSENN